MRLRHNSPLPGSQLANRPHFGCRYAAVTLLSAAGLCTAWGQLPQTESAVSHLPAAGEVHPAADVAVPPSPEELLAQQSRELLELATLLKSEVDKTNTDLLSLDAIRTAKQIEKVARGVKDRSKHSPGAR